MSAETDFRAALVEHAPLFALVGDRIAANAVPEGTPLPYIAFSSTHEPVYGLDGSKHAGRVTFEAQCWAESQAQADAVADAVEQAMALAAGTVRTRATGYSGELDLDAVVLTVEWWA
ncbi:DUF3168 domain-containing protein [Aquabacterium sp. A7-Y]|uniref:tail completion protein gp17 n=1 Tax=Aquabacterium sp. A7-Y TaxID=1349605 RepID=UPI00223D1AF8|nr:DUF3168 domain-containing protein [Aquabacterium sp. A7-Y]MCW7542014.1 DUF3168 domain-containing protein [Aquabacterium sp. A7-Y]